jgi:hypothetical protein
MGGGIWKNSCQSKHKLLQRIPYFFPVSAFSLFWLVSASGSQLAVGMLTLLID